MSAYVGSSKNLKDLTDLNDLPETRLRASVMGDRAAFFFFFITLGLELSDTKVYEP